MGKEAINVFIDESAKRGLEAVAGCLVVGEGESEKTGVSVTKLIESVGLAMKSQLEEMCPAGREVPALRLTIRVAPAAQPDRESLCASVLSVLENAASPITREEIQEAAGLNADETSIAMHELGKQQRFRKVGADRYCIHCPQEKAA